MDDGRTSYVACERNGYTACIYMNAFMCILIKWQDEYEKRRRKGKQRQVVGIVEYVCDELKFGNHLMLMHTQNPITR